MVLNVTDTEVLAPRLDFMNLEYDIISDTEANVYGEIPVSELSLTLAGKRLQNSGNA